MWGSKKPKPKPIIIPKRDNKYLFGDKVFAEWTEDRESEGESEGWAFFTRGFRQLDFYTDTESNAKLLLDSINRFMHDSQEAPQYLDKEED